VSAPVYAWHFLYEGHKMRCGSTAPDDGVWLELPGEPMLCSYGFHASAQPFDALSHAPGPILCLVEMGGKIVHDTDKLVAQKRRILARMDATEMLRYFARTQAMSVAHLWDAPDVVAEFLMTGDESIRAAARDAAWDAACDAAWDAARDAAWDAAWDAARDAARDAACDAAWDAARDAACDAAWDAAWDAARDAARREFNCLVYECFEGPQSLIDWRKS
jgi:hypothetical protein